jgi:hypothetical protein
MGQANPAPLTWAGRQNDRVRKERADADPRSREHDRRPAFVSGKSHGTHEFVKGCEAALISPPSPTTGGRRPTWTCSCSVPSARLAPPITWSLTCPGTGLTVERERASRRLGGDRLRVTDSAISFRADPPASARTPPNRASASLARGHDPAFSSRVDRARKARRSPVSGPGGGSHVSGQTANHIADYFRLP